MVILVRLEQFWKVPPAIKVTLSGIVMLVRLVQFQKAKIAMLVTLSGIVMLVRLVQPTKATEPIVVTPSGMVMFVRLVHPWKAYSPILVTDFPSMVSGMVSSPAAASLQSVMVTSPSVVVHVNIGSKVKPFQSSPLSPKVLRASIVTKATAPFGTRRNGFNATVGALP